MENFDLKSAKKVFSSIGIALMIFHAVTTAFQIAIGFIVEFAFPEKAGFTSNEAIIISSATMYLFGLPAYYLFLKRVPVSLPKKEKCTAKVIVDCFLMCVAISYFFGILGTYVANFVYDFAGRAVDSGTIELVSRLKWQVAFIPVVIVAPIAEEFMFRKMIIDRTRIYGEKLAIIFSGLLFGFYHMSIEQFFYTFPIGLLLAYLYMRKGSIWLSVLVHAAFNFFGTIFPLMFKEVDGYNEIMNSVLNPEGMYEIVEKYSSTALIISAYSLATLVFSFVGISRLGKYIRRVRIQSTPLQLPSDTEAETAFLNIGVVIFVIYALVYPFIASM